MNFVITFSYGKHKDKSDGYVRVVNAGTLEQVVDLAYNRYKEGFAVWTEDNFGEIPDGHFRKGCIGELDLKNVVSYVA
jgi:hypothetical protein